MKEFTLNDILVLKYCKGYTKDIIRDLWGDRETATAIDIINSGIPDNDKTWLLLSIFDLLDKHTVDTFRTTIAYFVADIWEYYAPTNYLVREGADRFHNGDKIVHFKVSKLPSQTSPDNEYFAMLNAYKSIKWLLQYNHVFYGVCTAAIAFDHHMDTETHFRIYWLQPHYNEALISFYTWLKDIIEVYEC